MGPVVTGLLALEVGGVGKKVVLFPHQHMKPSHRSACVAWSILCHLSRSGDTCLQIEGPLSRQVILGDQADTSQRKDGAGHIGVD